MMKNITLGSFLKTTATVTEPVQNSTTTSESSAATTEATSTASTTYYTTLLLALGLVIYLTMYICRRRNKKREIERREEAYLNYYHLTLPQSQIYRGSSQSNKSNLSTMVASLRNSGEQEYNIRKNLTHIASIMLNNPIVLELDKSQRDYWHQVMQEGMEPADQGCIMGNGGGLEELNVPNEQYLQTQHYKHLVEDRNDLMCTGEGSMSDRECSTRVTIEDVDVDFSSMSDRECSSGVNFEDVEYSLVLSNNSGGSVGAVHESIELQELPNKQATQLNIHRANKFTTSNESVNSTGFVPVQQTNRYNKNSEFDEEIEMLQLYGNDHIVPICCEHHTMYSEVFCESDNTGSLDSDNEPGRGSSVSEDVISIHVHQESGNITHECNDIHQENTNTENSPHATQRPSIVSEDDETPTIYIHKHLKHTNPEDSECVTNPASVVSEDEISIKIQDLEESINLEDNYILYSQVRHNINTDSEGTSECETQTSEAVGSENGTSTNLHNVFHENIRAPSYHSVKYKPTIYDIKTDSILRVITTDSELLKGHVSDETACTGEPKTELIREHISDETVNIQPNESNRILSEDYERIVEDISDETACTGEPKTELIREHISDETVKIQPNESNRILSEDYERIVEDISDETACARESNSDNSTHINTCMLNDTVYIIENNGTKFNSNKSNRIQSDDRMADRLNHKKDKNDNLIKKANAMQCNRDIASNHGHSTEPTMPILEGCSASFWI